MDGKNHAEIPNTLQWIILVYNTPLISSTNIYTNDNVYWTTINYEKSIADKKLFIKLHLLELMKQEKIFHV